jgi:hypothetical protein
MYFLFFVNSFGIMRSVNNVAFYKKLEHVLVPELPDFSRSRHIKMGENIPNDHKLYQMAINDTKWP